LRAAPAGDIYARAKLAGADVAGTSSAGGEIGLQHKRVVGFCVRNPRKLRL